MANAKSEFLREALRQGLVVAVYTNEPFEGQALVHVAPSSTWTISPLGFVNTRMRQSTIAWVSWKKVFHMQAADKHCVDWICVPRKQLQGAGVYEMIDGYKRYASDVRWFGSVSVGAAPQFARPLTPVRPIVRGENKCLPRGWRVISGGAR